MMKLLQIAIVAFVTWSSIHFEWHVGGYAIAFVSFFAALIVTCIIDELQSLLARFPWLRQRILGLQDKPRDEIASFTTATRHPRNTFQQRGRSRIGENPRQLVEVAAKFPLTVFVADDSPPLPGTEAGFGNFPDETAARHRAELLRIECGQ